MDKTRPILWMIDGLGPGGAEQLMPAILKHLKNAGFNLRICALQIKHGNPIARELERLGLPVDLLLIPNLRHPFNLFRIIQYLKKHRPQLLHTQLEFSDILGTLAAKLLGIPTVSTLHTLDATEDGGTADWRLKLRWFILRNFTNQVIAVSEKTRRHHLENAKISAKKIITVYNGVELARFKNTTDEERAAIKRSLNIPLDRPVILTVAVLREPKGIQFMLKALPAILEEIPNAHYLIAGDGTYKTPLSELTHALNLESHTTFAGHRTDIPALLDCCDVFVLPTLIDALPTVLIEALAAEKPIIASDVGGIPEIVEHAVNGLLVNAGDSEKLAQTCIELLENSDLCKSLVTAGSQTVRQRFDIRVQIEQLQKIYEEVVSTDGKQN